MIFEPCTATGLLPAIELAKDIAASSKASRVSNTRLQRKERFYILLFNPWRNISDNNLFSSIIDEIRNGRRILSVIFGMMYVIFESYINENLRRPNTTPFAQKTLDIHYDIYLTSPICCASWTSNIRDVKTSSRKRLWSVIILGNIWRVPTSAARPISTS